MKITMFSSWQVRCGIATYTADLTGALADLPETVVEIVPYDRKPHPRADYKVWGRAMNTGDVAHIQHEYSFFGYLTPWANHYGAFVNQIRRPLVITRHVTFDGPLMVPGNGTIHMIRRSKWSLYNRWLGPYATYLNRDTFAIADQIIVLSARLKTHLVERGLEASRIHVIPAGVPQVPTASGGRMLRATWNWTDRRVLGMFGYITPVKGHSLAVEALARLPKDVVLLIAGGVRRVQDRPVLTALERQIAALDLRDRVRITGYLSDEDTPAYIDACDLLLYPATHADSSYSLVTGIAYQHAPLVASDVFGHREVAERVAGIELFSSSDIDAMVVTIGKLLDNPQRRAELVAETTRYSKQYGWSAVAGQTHSIYLEAMQSESGRR